MIFREGAGGPFIIGAEQGCGSPAGKRKADMEYSILVNWLNLADDYNPLALTGQ